jgi:esterase/lipase
MVAIHYLHDRNKPFNMGEQVVKQATDKESVREKWMNDPLAKLKLTPRELLTFQRFMDRNPFYARQIKSTPVLVFQGDDDRLVKKKGTYSLFESLASNDKAMVLVGHTEHLIFEAGQFRDGITMGVIGWMAAHMSAPKTLPVR